MASRNSKGRMIYWKISYCKQLARCSLLAQLLFTWLIPNTDDLGRIEGDPEIIKGMIFPYHHNVTAPDVESALIELSKEDLITWYQVNNCWYISFPKFDIYQRLRKDRVYNSDYPSPASFVPTCHDMAGLDGQNMREVKRSEGEGKEKGSEGNKNLIHEIFNFRQRYSPETIKLIDIYIDILKTTRRGNKIADSVLFQVYENMSRYPEIIVQYACRAVIENPAHHSKKENYFYGIMRNTPADEADRKLKQKPSDKTQSTGNPFLDKLKEMQNEQN